MTDTVSAVPNRAGSAASTLLLGGVVLAAVTEGIASTVLSLGRDDIIGDTYASPDAFAWLDFGYLTAKLIGFLVAPWLLSFINPRSLVIIATLFMGAASMLAAITAQLDLLVLLRVIQGFSGGVLLIASQTAVFLAYPRSQQAFLQAVFAMGSVVAPATLAPALEGWLLDSFTWCWVFFSIGPLAMVAVGILLLADAPELPRAERRPFDAIGALTISVALFCFSYVLTQGSRWDWFEEPRIVWLTFLGTASLLAFLARQAFTGSRGLVQFAALRVEDFAFAFCVSFVAGAALFGSGFLIPAFAVSVLEFTFAETGALLLPSGALFAGSLLLAGFLTGPCRVPPIATVPLGILMIMAAMWMLSGATSESGAADMMAAILLRGFGLGFLFLSITLTAFMRLDSESLASGIGLFNAGRQLGGLIGVAGLETLIDHHLAGNVAVLGASVTAGVPAVDERLSGMTAVLAERGMEAVTAGRAAISLLDRALIAQSSVIAFNTAFNAVALLFVFAAPMLVAIKIALHRVSQRQAVKKDAALRHVPISAEASYVQAEPKLIHATAAAKRAIR